MVWKFRSNEEPCFSPPLPHHIQPAGYELAVAVRPDAAILFGKKGAFGDDIQAGKEPQSLIQDMDHHLAMAGIGKVHVSFADMLATLRSKSVENEVSSMGLSGRGLANVVRMLTNVVRLAA